MRAAKPDISAPLSRKKKAKSNPLLKILIAILTLTVLAIITFSYFIGGTNHIKTRQTPNQPYFEDKYHQSYFGGVRGHHPLKKITNKINGYATLSTSLGDIEIKFRPDLSEESVDYIRKVAKEGCDRCAFYRSEPPGIFQGIIKSNSFPIIKKKGNCPSDYQNKKQDCPEHDPNCGCHGPIMSKGMVGWAGGKTGPDFFINTYEKPAAFWGNQHT